ncbi:SHOCT domain-containing protein [Natronolimnobius baerhuensis]|uniref:SHOCT domain-containing protein n=1 Tax=Natronolimnobius baerhuensis TaxID=253108 RepID=A0A202E9I3_9EURY|nr:SHOCT domain-containing protein [Natronolimnobius baerhuensis]OVE84912.1 hypothetical protein B2G88_11140 [Natronolimnobius baerhuensis]
MASRRATGTLIVAISSFGLGFALHPFVENLSISLMFFGLFVGAPLFYFLYPTVVGESSDQSETKSDTDHADPLETLKHEYAAGRLTESEFEHKLQRLVDLEDEAPERHAHNPNLNRER